MRGPEALYYFCLAAPLIWPAFRFRWRVRPININEAKYPQPFLRARCRLLISSPRPEEQGRRVELRRSKLVAAAGSTDAIAGIYSAG